MFQYLLILLLLWSPGGGVTSHFDVIDDITESFKQGDSKQLSNHFSSTLSLTLLKNDGVYSKIQAEIILKEFFNRSTPQEVKLINKLDSNPHFKYVVLQMETNKGDFRVSYKLSSEEGSYKITELRLDKAN